jgi:hypothetical protein
MRRSRMTKMMAAYSITSSAQECFESRHFEVKCNGDDAWIETRSPSAATACVRSWHEFTG